MIKVTFKLWYNLLNIARLSSFRYKSLNYTHYGITRLDIMYTINIEVRVRVKLKLILTLTLTELIKIEVRVRVRVKLKHTLTLILMEL